MKKKKRATIDVRLPTEDGIRSLPGFEESLRILVQEERYSATDIGAMFGVSHQRIVQHMTALGIKRRESSWQTGLNCLRVWDDSVNRFRPIAKGVLCAVAAQSRRDARAALRQIKARRVQLAIANLAQRLGRTPTTVEVGGLINPRARNDNVRRVAAFEFGNRCFGSYGRMIEAAGLTQRGRGGAGRVRNSLT